jgi:hypothetical protein
MAAKSAGDRTPEKDGPVEGGRPPRENKRQDRNNAAGGRTESEREGERPLLSGGFLRAYGSCRERERGAENFGGKGSVFQTFSLILIFNFFFNKSCLMSYFDADF